MKLIKQLLVAILSFSVFISGVQAPVLSEEQDNSNTKRLYTIDVELLKTPETEVEDAIAFLLKNVEEEDRPFIKFFSTYALPTEELRQQCVLVLGFVLNSMMAFPYEGNYAGDPVVLAKKDGDNFVAYKRVPGSRTLWYVDIRELGWTLQAWENVVNLDGYFAEPIVPHVQNGLLRTISGNSVVRADWFIVHATDVMRQADSDKSIRVYRELVYPVRDKPKKISDFEKFWGVDLNKSRKLGNFFATLVLNSRTVARHDRLLFGFRTELGWYFRTFDVKSMVGKRDFAERFVEYKGDFPDVFDAGEAFLNNQTGMFVYELYANNGDLLDFADPSVARHLNDVIGDTRVRVAHSCFDCHAAGPIPAKNTVVRFIKKYGSINVPDKDVALKIRRTFLSGKFEDAVEDSQRLFARSLLKINGLEPDENARYYLNIVDWYSRNVDIKQAAYELGMTVEKFKEELSNKEKLPFRLALLINDGETIPREIWETSSVDGYPGLFQQAFILIHGLTRIEETVEEVKEVINVVGDDNKYKKYLVTSDCNLQVGTRILARLSRGDIVLSDGETNGEWLYVILDNDLEGWVRLKNVKIIQDSN